MRFVFVAVLVFWVPVAAWPAESVGEPEPMADVVRRHAEDARSLERFYDLPSSEVQVNRLEDFYRSRLDRLRGGGPETGGQSGAIDRLLLMNSIERELSRIGRARRLTGEVESLIPFRKPIDELEHRRWMMDPVDPVRAAEAVSGIADEIKKVRKRIEEQLDARKKPSGRSGPGNAENGEAGPAPVLALRAAEMAEGAKNTLQRWFEFYDGFQPEFSWWLRKPYEQAVRELEGYRDLLRERVAGLKDDPDDPLIGEPIGRAALEDELRHEAIHYTPEELIAIGERELAWCEREMGRAAEQMGYGEDWKAALERVKSDFVPPGRQDEWVARVAGEAIDFVKERDLVTVPRLCEETWRLRMISPEGQRTLPYAAYGGQAMLVAYASDAMTHADKLMSMRGNNRAFTRIVTAHELIPGHHLQRFVSDRNRRYRSLFATPFFVEGWAVYWELRLWEMGYPRTPEERIGMLFWRMHRCARIIVSLRFHLGQMTPEEMIEFLVERVGHERLGATSEVRRYIGPDYSPLYQCAYMIGALQLRALRREAGEQFGMGEREFHDAVLAEHAIPVAYVRAALLGLPLESGQLPEWRFAGEPGSGGRE